ncbi:SpoIIE family protein phosphatase [Streptomyces sp. NPDC057136]|uniref:SpoIIE family protein phosphatase n=1 Tax=Streptomyces sp. NPDC057136 TaxID=3346029 RepID=UPI00363DC943
MENGRSSIGFDAATGSNLELLNPIVAHVVRETGASVAMVYLLPPGGTTLWLALLAGVPGPFATPWTRVAESAPIPVADAVRERHLVWIGSQQEMARRYPRPALIVPYRFSLAAAPVFTGTRDWGGLVLLWPGSHSNQLLPHERDALSACCHGLGMLLRQAEAGGCPVLPGDQPRMLPTPEPRTPDPADAAAAVGFIERLPGGSCALDLDGVLTYANGAAADLVGVPASELLGTLPWESLPWLADPYFEDQYRAAVISRQPTSFTALRPPDRLLSFCLYPDASGVSVQIDTAAADASDQEPADTLARRSPPPAAPSRATALYHLMHLAATLTEAASTQDVVDLVSDQLMPALKAQALAVMTAAEGRLRIEGHPGHIGAHMARFDGAPLTSDTPAAHVLTTGDPCFFATAGELRHAYPHSGVGDGMAAWAFLPLVASGHPVGSLVLAYDRPRPFVPEERALLASIAGLIAQALDRARLYDAKNHLAHSLQAGLLPHSLPQIAGLDVAARYIPATRGMGIGGDFYDLIRLDATTAAVAIGDVQGHNVQAAALMGQVRTAVHASAGAPPDEVLARTNRLLTDLDPGLFTSCLYAHIDLPGHRALLATAGHPPPLLRHPDGHAEVLSLAPGLLLGIDPAARYPTTEIPLPPGSALALYTDGLVEAPGVDFDEATADLARHFEQATGQTMDALADTLVRYAERSTPGSDDIALLLVDALRAGA